jgi:hypothetical protein
MTATTHKTKEVSLDELWASAPVSERIFNPKSITHLPEIARRYLEHAVIPGAKLASAVRFWMQGEIKLEHKWHHFTAEEVVCWDRGMIWQAKTWVNGLPISGADSRTERLRQRVVDGVGHSQWKTFGLVSVVNETGADVTRSAIGRMQSESICLPSVLCHPDIIWTEIDATHVKANFTALGEQAELLLGVNRFGGLESLKFLRWGNPEGGEHHYVDFGGVAAADVKFGDYTIPTRLNMGWFFESERFESEGEFFRCTIDKAIYQ